MTELLTPGTQAPDFTLKSGDGDDVTLSDLRGQKVLAFYPLELESGLPEPDGRLHGRLGRGIRDRREGLWISIHSHWSHRHGRKGAG